MKTLLCLFILLSHICLSQGCKNIKKDHNVFRNETIYESPSTFSGVEVGFSKWVLPTTTVMSVNLALHVNSREANLKDMYVKFEDGFMLKLNGAKLACNYLSEKMFYLQGSMPVPKDLAPKFSKMRITKIILGNQDKDIPPKLGERARRYYNCILNAQ